MCCVICLTVYNTTHATSTEHNMTTTQVTYLPPVNSIEEETIQLFNLITSFPIGNEECAETKSKLEKISSIFNANSARIRIRAKLFNLLLSDNPTLNEIGILADFFVIPLEAAATISAGADPFIPYTTDRIPDVHYTTFQLQIEAAIRAVGITRQFGSYKIEHRKTVCILTPPEYWLASDIKYFADGIAKFAIQVKQKPGEPTLTISKCRLPKQKGVRS